jgi:hypothetical protein
LNSAERKLRHKYRYGELSYIADVYLEFELRANHTGEVYNDLKTGECRFDYDSWEKRLGLTRKTMVTAIKRLTDLDKAIRRTFKGVKGKSSKYILCRYEEQNFEQNEEKNKEHNKYRNINGLGGVKEQKEEQNMEQKRNCSSTYSNLNIKSINKYTSDSNEYRLAEYLYKHIIKNNPKAKEPNLQKWAKVFDLILRKDKRELEEVKKLITLSQQHIFWHKNILSPDCLRKQYDRLLLLRKESSITNEDILCEIKTKQAYESLEHLRGAIEFD